MCVVRELKYNLFVFLLFMCLPETIVIFVNHFGDRFFVVMGCPLCSFFWGGERKKNELFFPFILIKTKFMRNSSGQRGGLLIRRSKKNIVCESLYSRKTKNTHGGSMWSFVHMLLQMNRKKLHFFLFVCLFVVTNIVKFI